MMRAREARGQGIARRAVAMILTAFMLAGCAAEVVQKPAAVEAAVPLPPAAPRTTGVDSPAIREHKQLVSYFGGEYKYVPTERLLDEVLGKLASASDTPGLVYRVTILNSPVVNAFALPSGNIYVTRGLLALANDTSEIAAVMAHEIAHVTERHAAQRAELEKRSAVISKAADVIDDRGRQRSFKTYAELSLASFSRQQEIDADEVGVRTIARAGYDPFAASRFLVTLGRFTELRQSIHPNADGGKPDMMATHPSTPDRVAHAVLVARQISAPGIGDTGHDRYLAAITGLLYGDDPAEGFVRGRLFIHPKFGFAFTAPDGFVLENSAQAVLGVNGDGSQALRLDRVKVSPETSLQAYLGSGWIDGLEAASAETITVNGLSAATATAKSDSWSFRLAAIRVGGEVYRLTFAAKDLTPDVDRRFRDAIDTFHRTTTEDTRDVRAARIAVQSAGTGDTAATLGAAMAVPDHPVETFEVLNGLEGATLEGGRRYKVVVE